MIAASWTTALSYSFLSLAYLFISQRLSPVVYEKRRVFVTIVVTIGFVVGARFFPEMTPMSRIIAKSLYCMTYLGTLFLFKAADKREWVGLSSILRGRLAFAGISE